MLRRTRIWLGLSLAALTCLTAVAFSADQPKFQVSAPADDAELQQKLEELCNDLTKTYKTENPAKKPTIAVVEFSNLSGGVSDLGRLISEEMITKLFSKEKYKVVERFLLNKAIAVHKLQLQGLVDPTSAKELGKILGVDAIVSGTITEVGNSMRINARLISTETGEIHSVGNVSIQMNDSLKSLAGATSGKPDLPAPNTNGPSQNNKAQFPFRENFAKYEEGATNTDWGKNGRVKTGADGRKWLTPVTAGPRPVGIDIELPENTYIEFEYLLETFNAAGAGAAKRGAPGLRQSKEIEILSAISLVDESGAKYRIEWRVVPQTSRYSDSDKGDHRFQFPGQDPIALRFKPLKGTVSIRKSGHKLTIKLNDSGDVVEGDVSALKKVTRFEMDLYKNANASLNITNINIGANSVDRAVDPSGESPYGKPSKKREGAPSTLNRGARLK